MGGGYKHAYRWRSGDSVHWVRKQASRSVAARGAAAGGADAPEGVGRLPAPHQAADGRLSCNWTPSQGGSVVQSSPANPTSMMHDAQEQCTRTMAPPPRPRKRGRCAGTALLHPTTTHRNERIAGRRRPVPWPGRRLECWYQRRMAGFAARAAARAAVRARRAAAWCPTTTPSSDDSSSPSPSAGAAGTAAAGAGSAERA